MDFGVPNGAKIEETSIQKLIDFGVRFLIDSGIDFGGIWEAKMAPKSTKRGSQNDVKKKIEKSHTRVPRADASNPGPGP